MPAYTKRPLAIQAIQYRPGTNDEDVALFLTGIDYTTSDAGIVLTTPHGACTARPNDWIIRGVLTDCYPCEPNVFGLVYQPAAE